MRQEPRGDSRHHLDAGGLHFRVDQEVSVGTPPFSPHTKARRVCHDDHGGDCLHGDCRHDDHCHDDRRRDGRRRGGRHDDGRRRDGRRRSDDVDDNGLRVGDDGRGDDCCGRDNEHFLHDGRYLHDDYFHHGDLHDRCHDNCYGRSDGRYLHDDCFHRGDLHDCCHVHGCHGDCRIRCHHRRRHGDDGNCLDRDVHVFRDVRHHGFFWLL